jgi:putative transposase
MHERSGGSYGARRIFLDLRDEGERIARKRVERLMRVEQLSGYVKRRKFRTTFSVQGVRVAEDLVERDFDPPAPDRLWTSDIKYVSTWEGTLYLASVIDCFSRKVVGWSMRADMQAELVVDALEMAIGRRQPGGGLVCHSDQGSQTTFNPSSQQLVVVDLKVNTRSALPPVSSSRASCGVGC